VRTHGLTDWPKKKNELLRMCTTIAVAVGRALKEKGKATNQVTVSLSLQNVA
jgi:hypothetical protein